MFKEPRNRFRQPTVRNLGSLKGLQIRALDVVFIAEMVTINISWTREGQSCTDSHKSRAHIGQLMGNVSLPLLHRFFAFEGGVDITMFVFNNEF
jgi:hypothetical protein